MNLAFAYFRETFARLLARHHTVSHPAASNDGQ
jgi:hypothetical protein